MKRMTLNIMMALAFVLLPIGSFASTAYAANCGHGSSAKDQVLNGVGQTGTDCSKAESNVANTVSAAVQILSIVIGIAAVVEVISGGFKYITSGGDPQKVANAKNTLIYALVGLVIVALAQFMVHFVINTSNNSVIGSCKSDSNKAASDPTCK